MPYVIETYRPRSSVQDDTDVIARAARVGEDRAIRYLGAIAVPADETVFSLFEAPSIAALEAAATRAGLTVDRIVPATTTDLGGIAQAVRTSPSNREEPPMRTIFPSRPTGDPR